MKIKIVLAAVLHCESIPWLLFPSDSGKGKRLNRLQKRSLIKMDSVQLAIDFPAGLYFRHLCKGMQSHTLGTGISPPPLPPPSTAAYSMAHGALIAYLLLDFLHGYISLQKGKCK